MRVKIDARCMWGEGKDRKLYEPGSVIEVPEEIVDLNSKWMKPTDAPLSEAPEPKPEKDK